MNIKEGNSERRTLIISQKSLRFPPNFFSLYKKFMSS